MFRQEILTLVNQPQLWVGIEIATPFAVVFMVGAAIRHAMRGQSHRASQVLAVLYSLSAIAAGHLAFARTVGSKLPGNLDLLGLPSSSLLASFLDALIVPWLIFIYDPGHAVIMFGPGAVAIVAVWRMTARDQALVMGPYPVSSTP
jgi:hypothetical protein